MTNEVESHISEKYEIKKRLGKGAYGIVWKVIDKKTQEVMALKKIFDAFRNKTDAQRTFREIAFLKQFHGHPNIIKLYNVLKAENDKDIYLTFEFMETDLHNVIKRGNILKDVHKQYIMYQLLKATKYLHSANVIHRDQKPSNILLDSDCFVKLCDFGLARSLSERDNVNPSRDLPPLTEYVATRWYRAPEILMSSHKYTKGVDMWSLGCILGEMLLGKALFPGKSTINQIELIMNYIPKPNKEDIETMHKVYGASMITKINIRPKRNLSDLIPNTDSAVMDLVTKLLQFNPDKRITVEESLEHTYLKRFHNPVDEISMEHDVIPPVDDDIQLSVEEYRTRLYQFIMQNKAQKKSKKRASAKQMFVENDSTSFHESGSLINSQTRKSSMTSTLVDNKRSSQTQVMNDIQTSDKNQFGKSYDAPTPKENISAHNSSYNPSFKDINPVLKSGHNVNNSYSSASPSNVHLSREHRVKSGSLSNDHDGIYSSTYLIADQTAKHSHSHYKPKSEVIGNNASRSYISKTPLDQDCADMIYDYPVRKSSAHHRTSYGNDLRYLSENEQRKSQNTKKVEYELYKKQMFSPDLQDHVPLNTTYSNYPVRDNIQSDKPESDLYDYAIQSRQRSRSLRASYLNASDSRLDSGNIEHKYNNYSGTLSSNKVPIVTKHNGSVDNISKKNNYYDYTMYSKNNQSKSIMKNNNNIGGIIGTYANGSRPPSRGFGNTWYGQDKDTLEVPYSKIDSKRHQSAPLGYTSTINSSNRPPTSGLIMKDSSQSRTRAQYSSDYNDRMVTRARAPSSKLERTRTSSNYYRSSSPGLKYLPSEYNQRPSSKSGMYVDNQKYTPSYGSVSNNQLAHYYSRKWII